MKDADRLSLPLAEIQEPFDGAEVLMERWWCVQDGQVLFYRCWCSPQCNANKSIAERLGAKLHPGASVVHIPVAYVHRCDHG